MRRRLAIGLALALTAFAFAGPVLAQEDSTEPALLPLTEKPGGLSYKQWELRWGKLAANRAGKALITAGQNRCGIQVGNARLLPASVNGRVTVRCAIPADSFLVFPVIGIQGVEKNRRVVRRIVRRGFRATKRAALMVNGRRLPKPGHLVTTRVYRLRLQRGNLFDAPPGRYFSQSRAYFAILSAPPSGEHTIKTLGVIKPPGEQRFALGVTYRLTVLDAESG